MQWIYWKDFPVEKLTQIQTTPSTLRFPFSLNINIFMLHIFREKQKVFHIACEFIKFIVSRKVLCDLQRIKYKKRDTM
jgi:hypothetical protein